MAARKTKSKKAHKPGVNTRKLLKQVEGFKRPPKKKK